MIELIFGPVAIESQFAGCTMCCSGVAPGDADDVDPLTLVHYARATPSDAVPTAPRDDAGEKPGVKDPAAPGDSGRWCYDHP